jgi:hypothetical protein
VASTAAVAEEPPAGAVDGGTAEQGEGDDRQAQRRLAGAEEP